MSSALNIAKQIAAGQRRAVDVLDDTLARVRADSSNAFTEVTLERAYREAAEIDARRARGEALPALAGVPYAVKNLYDIAGVVTLAGGKVNAGNAPAHRDAALITRLRDAGAVLVGALNMDEHAYGFTTENTHFGPCRNPHDPGRIAGGSSGGSAAAVAAGLVPLTLGSDTNGSIRVPASLCGVFGLKPTYGRLPRSGSFPFVYSLDHLGPFAGTASDLALAYDSLQGAWAEDPACAQCQPELSLPALEGVRCALPYSGAISMNGPAPRPGAPWHRRPPRSAPAMWWNSKAPIRRARPPSSSRAPKAAPCIVNGSPPITTTMSRTHAIAWRQAA